MLSRFRLYILLAIGFFSAVQNMDAQTSCEVTFYYQHDTIDIADQVFCANILVDGFIDIAEFQLGIEYPTAYLQYKSFDIPILQNLTVEITDLPLGTILFDWSGASTILPNESVLGTICYDIIDLPKTSLALGFSDLATDFGIVVKTDGEVKSHCTKPIEITTPCSVIPFEFLPLEFGSDFKPCISGLEAFYAFNYWKYDESVFPMFFEYKETNKDEVKVSATLEDALSFLDYSVSADALPGNYEVTLINQFGCEVKDTFEIFEADFATTVESLQLRHTCLGVNDGSIGIAMYGDKPYDKLWSTGEVSIGLPSTRSVIDSLSPGLYWVEPINAACNKRFTYEVKDQTAFTATPNFHYSTCGGLDGSIWIDTEPQGDYTYIWEGRSETTSSLSGLTHGTYKVTVTDTSGCQRIKEITLGFNDQLTLVIDSSASCSAASGWSLTARTAAGNVDGISFEWFNGLIENGKSSSINNIAPGKYWVIASNALCQSDTLNFSLSDNFSASTTVLANREVNPPSCEGGNDGSIQLLASGSAGPHTYAWSDGEDTPSRSQLENGIYKVTISDGAGCSIEDSFDLKSNVVFEASIDEAASTLEVCPGELGLITILTNTSAPVFYHDQSGVNLGDTPALPVGEHIIDVFTDGGCMTQVTVEVTEQTLHMPLVTPIPQTLCEGLTYPLSLQLLDNVADLQGTINGDPWDLSDIIDLSSGQYDLNISNVEGCTWDTTIMIGLRELDILVPGDLTIEKGREIGIVTVHDDTEPLTYTWMATNPWSCGWEDCRIIDYNPQVNDTIYLDVRNEAGCIYLDTLVITVIDSMTNDTTVIVNLSSEDDFYIPNIILLSSNLNSEFCAHLTDAIQSVESFAMYDRWGNPVALKSGSDSSRKICLLDETKISDLSSGVYVYFIEVTLADGRVVRRAGDVTVVR